LVGGEIVEGGPDKMVHVSITVTEFRARSILAFLKRPLCKICISKTCPSLYSCST